MLKLSATRSVLVYFLALVSTSVLAQGVITTPRVPSPAAMVTQTVGISTVTVKYSRPSVKNREIWGKLVPYGYNVQAFGAGNEAPWRAGSSGATGGRRKVRPTGAAAEKGPDFQDFDSSEAAGRVERGAIAYRMGCHTT